MKSSNAVFWLLVALAMAGLIFQGVYEAKAGGLLAPGESAPAFNLQKYEGGRQTLADLKGEVVVVSFWASWCPPCVAEAPVLMKLAKEFASQKVRLVAVSQDENRVDVGLFVTDRVSGFAEYVVFGDAATSEAYRVHALPTLYIINREGKIVQGVSGAASESTLRRAIQSAISE